jgi:hypothetical protein
MQNEARVTGDGNIMVLAKDVHGKLHRIDVSALAAVDLADTILVAVGKYRKMLNDEFSAGEVKPDGR